MHSANKWLSVMNSSSSINIFHCLGLAWSDGCLGRENRFYDGPPPLPLHCSNKATSNTNQNHSPPTTPTNKSL